ncbi:MAG: sulfotransferase family 2 domain-containing protein [Lentisphaerae bacterium]|nr:sulfotransferase family 2 domain-containing protein [Lentisphaerota bacterium]
MGKSDKSKAPPPLIFLHIPKTAGTTLRTVLKRQYTRGRRCEIYTEEAFDAFRGLSVEARDQIGLLAGHRTYGLHTLFTAACRYVTVLRDPVARIVSHYEFVKQNRDHYLHDEVVRKQMDLSAYVTSGISVETDNCQARIVAGGDAPPFGQCGREMLDRAVQNIDRHFAGVGLTEKFDESLCLFQQALGWRLPLYISMNVARRRPRAAGLPPETRALIESCNAWDLALYAHALLQLEANIQAMGGAFERRLDRFRKVNRFYGRLWGPVVCIRSRCGL